MPGTALDYSEITVMRVSGVVGDAHRLVLVARRFVVCALTFVVGEFIGAPEASACEPAADSRLEQPWWRRNSGPVYGQDAPAL